MALAPDTARLIRLCVSSLIAGAIGIGSNIMSAINASGEVPRGALVIAIITGVMLSLKDIQAYLSTAPVVGMPPSEPPAPRQMIQVP
jgi:hypothetical protein